MHTYIFFIHEERKEKKKKASDNPSPEDYFNTFDFREIETDSPKQAALTQIRTHLSTNQKEAFSKTYTF